MTKHQPTNVEQAVYNMLLENTVTHFLDSGGAYGRHWQRNQDKTIQDFINQPAVEFDLMVYKEIEGQWKRARVENSIIWPHTRIGAAAVVLNSVVGRGCHIGRSAIVGPNSVLGDKTSLTDYTITGDSQ